MDGNRHSHIASRVLRTANLFMNAAIPVSDLRRCVLLFGDISNGEFDENLQVLIDEGFLNTYLPCAVDITDKSNEPTVRITAKGIRFLWWNG